MTNFEKITQSPEALGNFLASLPVPDGPWDTEFQRMYCQRCKKDDCDGCRYEAKRNSPAWWLVLEAPSEQTEKKEDTGNDNY